MNKYLVIGSDWTGYKIVGLRETVDDARELVAQEVENHPDSQTTIFEVKEIVKDEVPKG